MLAFNPFCVAILPSGDRCGESAAEVDHIIPRRQGGTDTPDNLQPLCRSCHARKTVKQDGGFGKR